MIDPVYSKSFNSALLMFQKDKIYAGISNTLVGLYLISNVDIINGDLLEIEFDADIFGY
jgi:hypothetical protein